MTPPRPSTDAAPQTCLPPYAPAGVLVIAGVGLLGGSLGLAAKELGLVRHVIGVGRRSGDLEEARRAGVIDEATTELLPAIARADIAILCQPVEIIQRCLPEVLDAAREDVLFLTDVGSTKGRLVAAAEAHPRSRLFVGSHPMAGSDKTGWRHARADLFAGATCYVTATDRSDLVRCARASAFWRALSMRTVLAAPDRHDQLAALLSHMPHMAAVAVIEGLAASHEDLSLLRLVSGSGLRDTTRVAGGGPDLWTDICAHNADAIAEELDALAERLQGLARLVRKGHHEELRARLATARDTRLSLD
ncbi:MAG: prephenate dehydrogenase [Sumerlaeia bacterium]